MPYYPRLPPSHFVLPTVLPPHRRMKTSGTHVPPAPCKASSLSIYSALPFSCSFPPPIPSLPSLPPSLPPSPFFFSSGHASLHQPPDQELTCTLDTVPPHPPWLTRLFAQSRADNSSSRVTSVRPDHVWNRDGCTRLRLQTNKQELIHPAQG